MDKQLLRKYINEYKVNFEYVNHHEIYKWEAVKCFQDNWDIEAENFPEMLLASIKLTNNLLKSGQYFPLRMIRHYSESKPNETRGIFAKLYNEDEDLYERINEFQSSLELLNSELFPGKNTYQDHRAVIVYLTLRYPERYFFYKFKMYERFAEKLNLIYRPVMGRIENIGHFNNLCELIKYELSQDQELLKLHKDRISANCYYDENLHILTQDFIYAVVRHLNQINLTQTIEFEHDITKTFLNSGELNVTIDQINFKGRTVNFIENSIENKRTGDLGELWVMAYEKKKLTNLNKIKLANKVKHVAKDEGDGTGYDIESYDENEKKIFIEVKTTKGNRNTTFYLTRSELERSKIEMDKYYLYRVYNYNEATNNADILVINGDLTKLCECPIMYKINLSNE
jgi:hypothetical protein